MSTSVRVKTIPEQFEKLFKKKPMKKVSKIKEFFKNCLALINDKYAIIELITLIEETLDDLHPKKWFKYIGKRLYIGWELQMTAHIGEYDMDYIILYLGLDVNIWKD